MVKGGRTFLLGLGVVLAATNPAAAQESARQAIVFRFDAHEPNASSGVTLSIDYVNPTDPAAKPPAVQTVVEALAPGTRINTSVPEQCPASDAELMLLGEAACPAGSKVGGGLLDVDTGLPGPTRTVENQVTTFNNENELILLVEPRTTAGAVRVVARAPITDGRVFTATVPPLPGGPPDGFSAIKRVRVQLEARVTGAGAYITTPPVCPPEAAWTNTLTLTYRDGVQQTASSASPCDRPTAQVPSVAGARAAAGREQTLPLTGPAERSFPMAASVLGAAAAALRFWAKRTSAASPPVRRGQT